MKTRKMLKKQLRFCLTAMSLFLVCHLLNAQPQPDSLSAAAGRSLKEKRTWELYIKPLALFDPLTGTVQAGLQKTFTHRLAVAFDYGVRMPVLSHYYKQSERQDYRYSKTTFELKYYLKKIRRLEAADGYYYLSLHAFYFPQTYTKTNEFVTLDSVSYHYDISHIKRTVFTFDLVAGYQLFGKRFTYNPYAGIGVRSIAIQHQAQGLQQAYPVEIPDFHFTSLDRRQGTFLQPNLVCGFRLGYRLGR